MSQTERSEASVSRSVSEPVSTAALSADPQLADWQTRVRDSATAGTLLRPRGGGSKDFYGGPLLGELFDTRTYAGIVAFEPTELVVTARCGTPLSELEILLAKAGQCLPFEPPAFGDATLGGVVAAGLSGPARMRSGALRDYVLGVRVIDGRGDLLRFGGEVMKNVAGYDVSRFMAGSMGTLGLITEVSLKVLPRPVRELTCMLELPVSQAIERVNEWAARPLPVSASAWHHGKLMLRLSGAAPAVEAAARKLGGERMADDEATEFWTGLREQTHPFFAEALAGRQRLWRLSLPSTAQGLAHDAQSLIEWGGGLRWVIESPGEGDAQGRAAAMHRLAGNAGGSACCFRSPSSDAFASESHARHDAFPPRAPAIAAIEQRLKQAFDPRGIFSRGRISGLDPAGS